MKLRSLANALVFVLVVLSVAAGQARQASKMISAGSSVPVSEKIKSLPGEWETKTPEGKSVTEKFQIVSAGSAVMITSVDPAGGEMVTMVYPDGTNIIATHY